MFFCMGLLVIAEGSVRGGCRSRETQQQEKGSGLVWVGSRVLCPGL